jgi:hypothetical protein
METYFSENRPIREVIFKFKDCKIKDSHSMECPKKVTKLELKSNQLKYFNPEYMKITEEPRRVKVELNPLFKKHNFDLKSALEKTGATEKDVYGYLKDWNDEEDLNKFVDEVKKDLS